MRRTFLLLASALFGGLSLSAAVVYQTPLPSGSLVSSSYINGTGGNRANYGYIAVGGSFGDMLGDDFIAPFSGTVDTITLYYISNGTAGTGTNTPQNEFSNLRLYYGGFDPTIGATLNQGGVFGFQDSYTSTKIAYDNGQPYESAITPGNYYDIYSLTYNTPGFTITAGNDYGFALYGTPIGLNTLALSASNKALTLASGIASFGGDDIFSGFELNGGGANFAPTFFTDINNAGFPAVVTKDVDINVLITSGGAGATPEPSTMTMAAAGLAVLAFGASRRRKA